MSAANLEAKTGASAKEMENGAATKEVEHDAAVAIEENGRLARDDVVEWAGVDDVDKPLNWTKKRKTKQIVVICYNTFLTYVKSTVW